MNATNAQLGTATLRKLLRERHSKPHGNGPEWAYLEEVRNEAGFGATRSLDAMALHLWASRGNELHGFEIKSSRSDWLRELKDPAKAEGFFQRCDRFWLVCPPDILKPDEIPPTWGALVSNSKGDALRILKQAPLNPTVQKDVTRSFLACMLRSAGAALTLTPDQAAIKKARDEGHSQGAASVRDAAGSWQKLYMDQQAEVAEWHAWQREFMQIFGVTLREFGGPCEARRLEIVAALKAVLSEEDAAKRARNSIQMAAKDLENIGKRLISQGEYLARNGGLE